MTPELKEYLKEAQKPMTMEERSDSEERTLGFYVGREKELSNFEITQEEIDRMKNEFGIDIRPNNSEFNKNNDDEDNKPLSLEERWASDVESRTYMLEHNPLESPPLTQEERERYKRLFNITFPDDI